jgi:hypothetical protein
MLVLAAIGGAPASAGGKLDLAALSTAVKALAAEMKMAVENDEIRAGIIYLP